MNFAFANILKWKIEKPESTTITTKKKNATSIWTKIHVYITQLSKHKTKILAKGMKEIPFEKLLK